MTPWIGQSEISAIDNPSPAQRPGFRRLFTHASRGLALFKFHKRHKPTLGNKLERMRSHWGHRTGLCMLCQIVGPGDGTEDKSALLVQC